MAVIALRFAPAPAFKPDPADAVIASLAPRATAGATTCEGPGWHGWVGASFARELDSGQVFATEDGVSVLFDGRLEPAPGATIGDAARVLAAYRDGESNLLALSGVFAFALVDERRRCLWLGRDVTGQRPLWWTRHGYGAAAASEAHAALRLADKPVRANDAAVAAHFALRTPGGDAGFLADVEELRPGMLWRFDAVGVRSRRFHAPKMPGAWLRLADDAAYAQAWGEALAGAVDAALSAAHAPGLSLSGGIDSGALAACAGKRVVAWSWSLPAHPECDEGGFVRMACAATGTEAHVFAGDAHMPLAHGDGPVHPDAPSANAFRALREAQLALAREGGCDVLLSGNYGDHAYPEADAWLFALLRSRRATLLGAELRGRWRRGGAASLWRDPGWRAPLRRLVLPPARTLPQWLTESARDALATAPREHDPAAGSAMNRRLQRVLLGRGASLDASLDTFWSDRHGIELRYPYRDPRVLAFVLALPSDVQWRHGQHKALTRRMLAGRLPDELRLRPKSGSLLPFFRAAVRGTQRARAEALLFAPDARWPAYARRDALERAWSAPTPTESDDLLLWQALSHERWWRALAREIPMLGSTA